MTNKQPELRPQALELIREYMFDPDDELQVYAADHRVLTAAFIELADFVGDRWVELLEER